MTQLGYPTGVDQMRARLSEILSESNRVTFVAESKGVVVGMAGAVVASYYERDGKYARLVALIVSSTARRRGIGTKMVKSIESWSAGNGASSIVVNSARKRTEAHRFYKRLGYLCTGFRFVSELPPASVSSRGSG